jgi:hypothetical protein
MTNVRAFFENRKYKRRMCRPLSMDGAYPETACVRKFGMHNMTAFLLRAAIRCAAGHPVAKAKKLAEASFFARRDDS